MTETTTTTPAKRPARPPKPPTFKVRASNPDDYQTPGKLVFSSESETQARNYVKQHHPRGREVHLELPDGSKEHYSADHNAQGHDDDGWFEYSEDEDA